MDSSFDQVRGDVPLPPPLTPERVTRALEQIDTLREQIRARGVDLTQLPDPVDALTRARETGRWE